MNDLMHYDPATGTERPYPSEARQWRAYHERVAWLFNPWTGKRRDARDVGSDPFGECLTPPVSEPRATRNDEPERRITPDRSCIMPFSELKKRLQDAVREDRPIRTEPSKSPRVVDLTTVYGDPAPSAQAHIRVSDTLFIAELPRDAVSFDEALRWAADRPGMRLPTVKEMRLIHDFVPDAVRDGEAYWVVGRSTVTYQSTERLFDTLIDHPDPAECHRFILVRANA